MNDPASISLRRRAALLATAINRLLTVGLLLGFLRIVFTYRRPMLLQTRERSYFLTSAQLLIQWLALCSALQTALYSSGAIRPI